MTNRNRIIIIDHQLAVHNIIAKRDGSSHPHALLLGRSDLVADPFAGYLAFELGKAEQYIEGPPSHAGGVLNDWVTYTKLASLASRTSTILAKSDSPPIR